MRFYLTYFILAIVILAVLLSMLLFALTSGTVWLHPIVCLIVALLFFTISLAYYNRKLGG